MTGADIRWIALRLAFGGATFAAVLLLLQMLGVE